MRREFAMAFAASGLDRVAELRGDADALAQKLASDGRVLPLWRGKPLIVGGQALGWLAADSSVFAHGGAPVFLGLEGEVAYFARDISDWSPEAGAEAVQSGFYDASQQYHPALPEDHLFVELRGVMTVLSAREAELAATAKSVLHWHRSHRYCAVCGSASEMAQGGWQRGCPSCGAQHFPRTDPVVIMMVTHGNSALMGRSPNWPEGMYSCLAGFIEPGETAEAAVCREVAEEAGIRLGKPRYIASQPWPFPSSLMLGFHAEAETVEIQIDPAELEDARWVSREDLVAAMAGHHPEIKPARRGSIAHALIANWLADWRD
ncbi:MAG: NAD(+) diphosphatase [Pseudorhodobacter sp.]